jgi:Lysozyme like domain
MAKNAIERLIMKYFPENYEVALAVAKAESGLIPTASNWKDSHRGCKGSFGVFQIACVHESNYANLYDVEYNVKRAREIYDETGTWKAWGAYTSGAYLAKL